MTYAVLVRYLDPSEFADGWHVAWGIADSTLEKAMDLERKAIAFPWHEAFVVPSERAAAVLEVLNR